MRRTKSMISPRLGLAFAVSLILAVPAATAENSVSKTVTGAFNTVVIQTTNAAAQAAKAAEGALTGKTQTKRKPKKATEKKFTDKSKDKPPKNEAATASSKTAPETASPADGERASDGTSPDASAAAAGPAKSGNDKSGKDAEKAGAAGKASPEPTEWPAQDIELANARCTQLLKSVDAVTIPEAPFRQGECGAPAPVRLISIGKKPEVSFSPPPLVTCDMVVALSKWVNGDLQPLARKHLGGDIIKVETMSDYSCRKAYGRIANRLSEHGKANALDIRGFVTNKGQRPIVLTGWGETKRDFERKIAAAKAAAEKAEALKAEAMKVEKAKIEAADAQSVSSKETRATASSLPRPTIIEGVPGVSIQSGGLGMLPTHLGGPKPEMAKVEAAAMNKPISKNAAKEAAAKAAADIRETASLKAGIVVTLPKPSPHTPTMSFLRDAHQAACRIFGTTLGPEANEAHRNHFHVDMAERKFKKICR